MKNISRLLLLVCISLLPCVSPLAFAQSAAINYLNELGVSYYKMGRYDDALAEFKKVLLIEPADPLAQRYIAAIFRKDMEKSVAPQPAPAERRDPRMARASEVSDMLTEVERAQYRKEEKPAAAAAPQPEEKKKYKVAGLTLGGEVQVSMGVQGKDFIWNKANADLNEKNYRMLSTAAYDRKTNTFDPRIFDRLKVTLDSENEQGFNFHGNMVADPWSYVGKGPRTTLQSDFGDTADVELRYWGNTRYIVNSKVYSTKFGNAFSIPEVKADGKEIPAFDIKGAFFPADTIHVPETKIDTQFKPLREVWVDYKQPGANFRVFPIGYQDQALTFDDPLVLSNNHIWWQQSPWLDKWQAGHLNYGATPVDFFRGYFDDSLSYFTRDSDGTRLTSLRGAAMKLDPTEKLSLASTVATPMDLWQDYDSYDNVISASRIKYRVADAVSMGTSFTYRAGFNDDRKKDYGNAVWGYDMALAPAEGLKANLEVAGSQTEADLTSPGYKSKRRGNAYLVSMEGVYPRRPMLDEKFGYNGLKAGEEDSLFAKCRFLAAHMDTGFNPSLSNYRETRDDMFWSRHLHFRRPFDYYYAGLESPSMGWDDIASYRIGNGIDIGRDVLGFRLETSAWDQRVDNFFDVRNVHDVNGKFVENVVRDEITFKATEKLTTKLLGIYQRLPHTVGGVDPFIFDPLTGKKLANAAIEDGLDPTLKTGSFGMEYAFTPQVALSGIWERTNDSTLAYDNFPRGILNSASMITESEYDRVYRRSYPFLYSQGLYPLPPYKYFDIYKTGLRISPIEKLDIYLDYTRNEFKSAGMVDDNINHIGFELSYIPMKKFGFLFKYTYSRWNDVNRMLEGQDKIYLSHHNFFSEFRYLPGMDDELVLQYGEAGITPIATTSFDPFGGGLSTLDTQHIIRMYYRRKF